MFIKPNRESTDYVYTIDMTDLSDLKALADLRARLKLERKHIKQMTRDYAHTSFKGKKADVRYRKPTLPNKHGAMRSFGNSVSPLQNPLEADVYIRPILY